MKKLRLLSVFMVVAILLTMSSSVYASPVHSEYFTDAQQMFEWVENYCADYPDVEYAKIEAPSQRHELKNKNFLVVDIDNDNYTMTDLSCGESGFHHGIDYTFSAYDKNNGYTRIRIFTYYQMSQENVNNSLEKLKENPDDGALYTGEVAGYPYVVCDIGWEDGSTDCTYKIAVDDVLIDIHSNSAFDKALLDSLVIENTKISLPVYEALPEVPIEVSDELLQAAKKEYRNDDLTKDDIHISDLETVNDTKQLVRFTVSDYGYNCAVTEKEIGDYLFYVPQRPLPQILVGTQLYDIDYAYENGILTEEDMQAIVAFKSRSYRLIKTDDLYGDADSDMQVTVLDATTIQRYLVGDLYIGSHKKYADYDRDGQISILDATAIQRKLAGY